MTAAPEEPKARWMGMLDRTRCETNEGLHLPDRLRRGRADHREQRRAARLSILRAHDGCADTVVTVERALAERVRETGAEVVGPRWLLDRFVE